MVWSPNIGMGYPFLNSGYDGYIPTPNSNNPSRVANFQVLNTDTTGGSANVLDALDDPYTPYYPGDEYVDWVGISVYNYNHDYNSHQTTPVTLDVLSTGKTSLIGDIPVKNFYQNFVVGKNKPFIISETGSAYITNDESNPGYMTQEADPVATELAIKESW